MSEKIDEADVMQAPAGNPFKLPDGVVAVQSPFRQAFSEIDRKLRRDLAQTVAGVDAQWQTPWAQVVAEFNGRMQVEMQQVAAAMAASLQGMSGRLDAVFQAEAEYYFQVAQEAEPDLDALQVRLEINPPSASVILALARLALSAGGRAALTEQGRLGGRKRGIPNEAAREEVIAAWIAIEDAGGRDAKGNRISKDSFARGTAAGICTRHKVNPVPRTISGQWLHPDSLRVFREQRNAARAHITG